MILRWCLWSVAVAQQEAVREDAAHDRVHGRRAEKMLLAVEQHGAVRVGAEQVHEAEGPADLHHHRPVLARRCRRRFVSMSTRPPPPVIAIARSARKKVRRGISEKGRAAVFVPFVVSSTLDSFV